MPNILTAEQLRAIAVGNKERRSVELVLVTHPHTASNGQTGWRWAVHMGVHPTVAAPLDGCLNAGFSETPQMADLEGQNVLYTVHAFAVRNAIEAKIVVDYLDEDIVPAPQLEPPVTP